MMMLISTLAVVGMTMIAQPAFAVDSSISSLCDGSASGYNRPGGYCDQIASNASLLPKGGGSVPCGRPYKS